MSKEEMKPHQSVPLWHNRDYLLLWSGQGISSIGTQVSQLAFPLLVLALTHSPAQAGFAGALRALPYLILSLPAGALIDRWDRKRVMILCDTGRAISMASIPIAFAIGQLTIIQLYLVSAIEGTLFVFYDIAETACLPRVVQKEQLPSATAQNSATEGLARLLGPSFSGALYSLGRTLPFLTDAVSYAVSVLSLFFIKMKFQGERVAARCKLQVEILEGLKWLWHQQLIRFMALLAGGITLTTAGFILILIVLAQHQHASPFTIGLIFGVGGIGSMLGSLVAGPLQKRLTFGQAIISTSWLWALLWPLYAIAPSPIALGGITVLIFTLAPIYNVVQFSYRLALIPDELQGRVNSAFRLIAFSGQPLGLALTGLLIQTIDVVPTILVYSIVFVVLAVAATLNPHVRNARPLAEVQTHE
jgi:MFS family permease